MTHPSWGALSSMAHSFLEWHKVVIHAISMVSFLWLWFSFWRLWDYSSTFLMGGTHWGKLGLALGDRAMLSKSLIQLSAGGWGCAPSLLVVWPVSCLVLESAGSVIGLLATSKNNLCQHPPHRIAAATAHIPSAGHGWPRPPQEILKHSQAGLAQSLAGSLLLSSGPGMHKILSVPSKNLCFPQSCGSSIIKSHCPSKLDSLGIPSSSVRSPGWEVWCGA